MAAHIDTYSKPDAETLAVIEAMPVEDGRQAGWGVAMEEYNDG